MAFAITKQAANGDGVTYWVLASVQVDYETRVAVVTMAGYRNKASREAKHRPLMHVSEIFGGVNGDTPRPAFVGDVTQSGLYARIKALPGWSGAKDV